MTKTQEKQYRQIVEAKELLQKFNEEGGGEEVSKLFNGSVDTVAMAAVLMSTSFNCQSGWSMPSTEEALRFYDEAERRFWDGEGIPLRYDSYDQLSGQYESISLYMIEQSFYYEISDEFCQNLGTQACDYAWVEGEWTKQDILPLIHNLERMVIEM